MKTRRILPILLAGMLQLMPMLRTMLPMQTPDWAPSGWAIVMKLAAGVAAFLGGYQAVSGATQIVAPYTINGTVGTAYSRQLTTSGQTAHSWSANTAALGSAVFPLVPGLSLTNSNGKIGGVPTVAITTNVTISAWENSGNKGASVSAVFTITITNSSGPSPPVITTQPQSQTNFVGSSATFNVAASGTAPLGYQWSLNGTNISGATASNYTRANLQTGDAGNYAVRVTNAAGSTNSANAVLTVLVPSADLVATGSGPASIPPGGNYTCTVVVSNLGPNPAGNVVVADALPAGAAFVSASGGGTVSAGVVTWPAINPLAAGAGASYTVTMTAPSAGTLTNTVSASSSTADPNAANNNGTAAAARVVTTVTQQADIVAVCSGPANVTAGANFSYTITVSNVGPSTANDVSVSDNLPPAAVFVSATGSGTVSSGAVNWPVIASLAAGASTSFNVTVTAPGGGVLTNAVSASSSVADPVPSNNDGSSALARVITAVGPQADLVATCSGATVVLASSNLTYTINVTNLGPSTATNVVVTDRLPANSIFVTSSGGGVLSAGVLTWPALPTLGSGGTASYTVTVTAPASGSLTNIVSAASSTPDPAPANNNGTAPASQVITLVATALGQFGISVVTNGVNPQSGLFEERVTVTNIGPATAAAVRLYVDGLRAGVTLYNATGTNAGRPYVQSSSPLNPGSTVSLLLEFLVSDRQPFTSTFEANAVLPAVSTASSASAFAISRVFMDNSNPGSPRFVIEFATTPGQSYTVIYTDDGAATWRAATPSVTVTTTVTQWYDDGPPKTVAPPTSGIRMYRVIAGPAGP